MDWKQITGLIVGVVIGVLLLTTLAVPVITGVASEELTYINEGSYFTTPDGDEHTIVVNATSITYDGEECIYPDLSLYNSATVIMGTDWFLRLESSNGGTVNYILVGPPQQYLNAGNSAGGDLTIIINDTTATISGPSQQNVTRNDVTYVISNAGDYVLSHDPYVLEDTEFIGGIRNVTTLDIMEIVSGEIGDPENYSTTQVRVYSFNSTETGTITDTEFTLNMQDVTTNLKKLNDITQNLTLSFTTLGEQNRTITIDYIIVPEKIVYDNPDYIGGNAASLLVIVPLLITVGIIMAVVGLFVIRRE